MTGDCVLDADVVIAVLDRADLHHRTAARALRGMIGDGTRLLLSLVNYAEALVRPADDIASLRVATDAIHTLGIELVAPTRAISREAARLRSSAGISLPDGFALATAVARSSGLATFDRDVRNAATRAGAELPLAMR
jgi:predicted nucleic acid-binding protein